MPIYDPTQIHHHKQSDAQIILELNNVLLQIEKMNSTALIKTYIKNNINISQSIIAKAKILGIHCCFSLSNCDENTCPLRTLGTLYNTQNTMKNTNTIMRFKSQLIDRLMFIKQKIQSPQYYDNNDAKTDNLITDMPVFQNRLGYAEYQTFGGQEQQQYFQQPYSQKSHAIDQQYIPIITEQSVHYRPIEQEQQQYFQQQHSQKSHTINQQNQQIDKSISYNKSYQTRQHEFNEDDNNEYDLNEEEQITCNILNTKAPNILKKYLYIDELTLNEVNKQFLFPKTIQSTEDFIQNCVILQCIDLSHLFPQLIKPYNIDNNKMIKNNKMHQKQQELIAQDENSEYNELIQKVGKLINSEIPYNINGMEKALLNFVEHDLYPQFLSNYYTLEFVKKKFLNQNTVNTHTSEQSYSNKSKKVKKNAHENLRPELRNFFMLCTTIKILKQLYHYSIFLTKDTITQQSEKYDRKNDRDSIARIIGFQINNERINKKMKKSRSYTDNPSEKRIIAIIDILYDTLIENEQNYGTTGYISNFKKCQFAIKKCLSSTWACITCRCENNDENA